LVEKTVREVGIIDMPSVSDKNVSTCNYSSRVKILKRKKTEYRGGHM